MPHAGFSKLTYLKSLRGHQMSPSAYRVLVEVFNYTNASGGHAHPGERRLAEDTGLAVRSVRAHLKWLTDNGYLKKGPRGHGGGGQGPGWATVYAVALPAGRPLSTSGFPSTHGPDALDQPAPVCPLSDPASDPSDHVQQSGAGDKTHLLDNWETQLREELGD
jgi:hypothetical protein